MSRIMQPLYSANNMIGNHLFATRIRNPTATGNVPCAKEFMFNMSCAAGPSPGQVVEKEQYRFLYQAAPWGGDPRIGK